MKIKRISPPLFVSVLSLIAFFTLWEALVRANVIPSFLLPPPSAVLREGFSMTQSGTLQADVLLSTTRVLIGFFLSSVFAIPFGLLLGQSAFMRTLFMPVISLIRPLPSMSWIPLSMIWLGIGESQKYAIVFMGSFTSILIYVIDAALKVEQDLILAAENMGANKKTILFSILLPGAMPYILSGLKVALAIAWTCIISAEMVGAHEGLGFRIWTAKDYNNTAQVLVGMAGISFTVLLLDRLFQFAENKLTPWAKKS